VPPPATEVGEELSADGLMALTVKNARITLCALPKQQDCNLSTFSTIWFPCIPERHIACNDPPVIIKPDYPERYLTITRAVPVQICLHAVMGQFPGPGGFIISLDFAQKITRIETLFRCESRLSEFRRKFQI
jgi:hypothetical protein